MSPENKKPVRPLHTADIGNARLAMVMEPIKWTACHHEALCRRNRKCSPLIFQQPIIHASIPRIAPIMEPHRSPARVSLDHHTVRMIGMTAGLSTIPLRHPTKSKRVELICQMIHALNIVHLGQPGSASMEQCQGMFSPSPGRCLLDGAVTQVNTFPLSNWKKSIYYGRPAPHPYRPCTNRVV
jgi:hypothetical protein